MLVTLSERAKVETRFGPFETCVGLFGDGPDQILCAWTTNSQEHPTLLRIQYGCAHGAVLRSLSCDCGSQIDHALSVMAKYAGPALFVYFVDHEAYGLGIFEKMSVLRAEYRSGKSYSELVKAGRYPKPDNAVLWVLPYLLDELGFQRRVVLLTANSTKAKVLRKTGVKVDRVRKLPASPAL